MRHPQARSLRERFPGSPVRFPAGELQPEPVGSIPRWNFASRAHPGPSPGSGRAQASRALVRLGPGAFLEDPGRPSATAENNYEKHTPFGGWPRSSLRGSSLLDLAQGDLPIVSAHESDRSNIQNRRRRQAGRSLTRHAQRVAGWTRFWQRAPSLEFVHMTTNRLCRSPALPTFTASLLLLNPRPRDRAIFALVFFLSVTIIAKRVESPNGGSPSVMLRA